MKKYETPEISIARYELSNKIMEGYKPGDVGTQASNWADLFTTQAEGSPTGVDANILD